MEFLVSAALAIVGGIHLLPLTGIRGSAALTRLYGVPIDEKNLEILMRHRAVLFGMLGALLVYAAFVPEVRTIAFIAGFLSVVSFLALAGAAGGVNAKIRQVVITDVIALVILVIGVIAHTWMTFAP
ncbi:MAG: hypothetical protein P0Y60_01670 [Candidatus Microbacterium colombiense]|nr:MAG: hypothetical protein P0Y60_01670 [Microbacterium sp.]